MKQFQFINLVGFNKEQQGEIIKCLDDSLHNNKPIILVDIDILLEESETKNIQLITLKSNKIEM